MNKQLINNKNIVPNGWITVKLGEICEEVSKRNKLKNGLNEFIYIDINSIDNKRFRISEPKTYKWEDAPSRAQQIVNAGDILFSTVRTYLKNIAVVSDQLHNQIASTGFCIIRGNETVNNKYLFYYSLTKIFLDPLNELQRGSSYPAVRNGDVFAQNVPLPPSHEQHRIVAKIEELFSELDKGVEALKTAQQQLKVYRQAVLKWAFEGKLTEEWRSQQKDLPTASQLLEQIKAEREKHAHTTEKKLKPIAPLTELELSELPSLPHGWCWTRLGDLANLITKGASPKWQGFNYVSDVSQLLFITSENVRQCYLNISEPKYLEIAFSGIQKRSELKFGDILFNIVGASIGRAAIFNLSVKANINQAVCLIRLSEIVLNFYLVNYLNSVQLKKYYENRVVDVARANLSLDDVSKFPIPFCTIQEQNQIVQEIETRLSVADKLEETIAQSLQQAEALRQSILKKAFAGKLVPQNPNDEPASKLLERIKAERASQAPVKKSTINTT